MRVDGCPSLLATASRESFTNSLGRISHVYEFSPGAVVASGGQICANSNNFDDLPMSGVLRGFLTKDK